jgi:hypothetical protein
MENNNKFKDYFLKEIEVIQDIIKRMGFNSFMVKGKHRGHVLNLESLSLPIRLSTFLRTFLSLAMVFEALRTAWDTADSLTLYP